mmetsp:Transcript_16063/g.41329  ORF Transcript_16063/g.41329 Transcript_16063/m.41329 type:complete len:213 (-) Transcript_16063:221-859(-)
MSDLARRNDPRCQFEILEHRPGQLHLSIAGQCLRSQDHRRVVGLRTRTRSPQCEPQHGIRRIELGKLHQGVVPELGLHRSQHAHHVARAEEGAENSWSLLQNQGSNAALADSTILLHREVQLCCLPNRIPQGKPSSIRKNLQAVQQRGDGQPKVQILVFANESVLLEGRGHHPPHDGDVLRPTLRNELQALRPGLAVHALVFGILLPELQRR